MGINRLWLIVVSLAWLWVGVVSFIALPPWSGDSSFRLQQATDTMTPTASPTNSATLTASVQPSATLTATLTISPTFTATLIATASPTQTAPPSATPAPGVTVSPLPPPSVEAALPTPEEPPVAPTLTATYVPLPVVTYQFPQRATTLSLMAREQPAISEKTPKVSGIKLLWLRFARRIGPYAPLFFLGALWAGLALWFFIVYVVIERK